MRGLQGAAIAESKKKGPEVFTEVSYARRCQSPQYRYVGHEVSRHRIPSVPDRLIPQSNV